MLAVPKRIGKNTALRDTICTPEKTIYLEEMPRKAMSKAFYFGAKF